MILLLVAFGLIIYGAIHRALVNEFDASLASAARMLAASAEQDGNEVELESGVEQMPEFQDSERPTYYQLWGPEGTVPVKSASLGAGDLLPVEGSVGEPVFQALQFGNGQAGRAVSFKFYPRMADGEGQDRRGPTERQPMTLVVARYAGDLEYHLKLLRWLLIITSVGTITLSFLVGIFVVGRGLRPLNLLAAEIAGISEDNLSARIVTEDMPAEIVPIKNRLNELLTRLEESFKRERRFTADVAHELRTPLAGMRSTLEVTLTRKRDLDEYQTSLGDCLSIVKSMQAMINNLLTLARIETKQVVFRRERIDLSELMDRCWQCFSQAATKRDIVFENRLAAGLGCQSDREYLSIVLSNLLDNAVEYVNEGGRIWVTGRQIEDTVEITVVNTGCRLTNEQVAQVFDCFWRGDQSRTGTGTHCGLGLALVQRIVGALGGRAFAEVQAGGVFTVRLVLPIDKASGNCPE